MTSLIRATLLATSMLCLSIPASNHAFAAPQTPVAAQTAPQPPDLSENETSGQAQLTEKQILAVIAAQKGIDAIFEKVPEDQRDNLDRRTQGLLDKAAKKAGFADFSEYGNVVDNIIFILEGFDAKTKSWVGPEVLLKRQIAEVKADTTLSAQEKTKELKELKEQLRDIEPVKFPTNIQLVGKYFDQLSELFGDED